MKRVLPLVALGLLAGCGSQQQQSQEVTALMAGYTLAATGVASYANAPGSDPAKVKAVRACEDAAWKEVKPVSDALLAKQPPTDAAMANANAALNALNSCLTSFGVKS